MNLTELFTQPGLGVMSGSDRNQRKGKGAFAHERLANDYRKEHQNVV